MAFERVKTIGYAYPTSSLAVEFKRAEHGVWYVALGQGCSTPAGWVTGPRTIQKRMGGFATATEAYNAAECLPERWDPTPHEARWVQEAIARERR